MFLGPSASSEVEEPTVPTQLGKASRLISLWPPKRGPSSCATPGCWTTGFLEIGCQPWPETQARGEEGELGILGSKGKEWNPCMGKWVITHSGSTQGFNGPEEAPVHSVGGQALISSAYAGQAGNDCASGVPALPAPAPQRASPSVPEWIHAHTSSRRRGPRSPTPRRGTGTGPTA